MRFAKLGMIALLVYGSKSTAQTFNITTGTASWNVAGNWTPSGFPNATGASATFNSPTGTQTVNLSAAIIVGSINVTNNSANVLTIANGGGSLTMDATSGNATIVAGGSSTTTNNLTISASTTLTDTLDFTVNSVGTGGSTATMTGTVAGGGGFIKNGAGRFSFTSVAKAYTGATTINQGRLRYTSAGVSNATSAMNVNSGGSLVLDSAASFSFGTALVTLNGAGTVESGVTQGALRSQGGTSTLTNAVTLASDSTIYVDSGALTLSGAVNGNFQLTKTGTSGLVFGNANAGYVGSTWLTAGTITVNAGANLGTGTLKMGDDSGSANVALTLNNAAQSIGSLTQGAASVSRTINLGTNHSLSIKQTTAGTFSGTIGGATGSVTLINGSTGTLTLTGSNSYGGTTNINGGVLEADTIVNGASNSSIGASSSAAANLIINGGTLRYVGSATISDRALSIGASGGTIEASGSGTLDLMSAGTMGLVGSGTRTLTLGGSNTGVNAFSAIITDNGGNATSLVKAGVGTWSVGNINTYTGGTTINGGKLLVGFNSSGSGLITVNSTGTLGGDGGALVGPVSVKAGGTIAPGNSVGILSVGATTFDTVTTGATYAWEVSSTAGAALLAGVDTGASGTAGTQHDQLKVAGNLDFGAGAKFTISSIDNTTGVGAALAGFNNANSYSWLVSTVTGTISNLANVAIIDTQFIGQNGSLGGRAFWLNAVGGNLYLNFSVVPEPGSILAVCATFAAVTTLVVRRRRRPVAKASTQI